MEEINPNLFKSSDKQGPKEIENTVFSYKKYPNTVFVPTYPRAHVEEVIGIDYDRRTVTARFVIHLTVCLNVSDPELKTFLKDHLILQFGYNQIIYIPQLMKLDNPEFIIEKVIGTHSSQNYITYKIRGNLECYAAFDHMFFPYRQIEVINHLVIRSQSFRNPRTDQQYQIKYNALLMKKNDKYFQFSPHIIYPEFAGFSIVYQSTNIFTDESKVSMKKKFKAQDDLFQYLENFIRGPKVEEKFDFTPEELVRMIFLLGSKEFIDIKAEEEEADNHEEMEEFCPFKHITFKFQMSSTKLAFILQNQVPIWALGVVTLYLFTANADIGNRYGNAILIIVSMIALLTNYRLNNVSHHAITFYQTKIMMIMIVPILLIISTAVDYYSNLDPALKYFVLRASQIQNPFMLVSIIVYALYFVLTLLFYLYMFIYMTCKAPQADRKIKIEKIEEGELWENLQEMEWEQPSLVKKIADLMVSKYTSPIVLQGHQGHPEVVNLIMTNRLQSLLGDSKDSKGKGKVSKVNLNFRKVQSEINSNTNINDR